MGNLEWGGRNRNKDLVFCTVRKKSKRKHEGWRVRVGERWEVTTVGTENSVERSEAAEETREEGVITSCRARLAGWQTTLHPPTKLPRH